jgi:uncharacterized protein
MLFERAGMQENVRHLVSIEDARGIPIVSEIDEQPFAIGPLQLLIVQGSPSCNIDCSYCYLPDRLNNNRMSRATLEAISERICKNQVASGDFTVVWHAGEPLTLPLHFYEAAMQILSSDPDRKISHSIQSNGTLLSDEWCAFISAHHIRVGLSIDGPEDIHNSYRRDRRGHGTHAQVIKATQKLKIWAIPFDVICVITDSSLDKPNEIYEFFLKLGARSIGFNVEENEGVHLHSSLANDGVFERVQSFFSAL